VHDELDQSSDTTLVGGVVQRSVPALEEIYRRHGGGVLALARRVTNDQPSAEEVCQTVFTSLWTAPDRFDPDRGSLRAWLLAQSHRRAVDIVRSETARRRRQERVVQLAPERYDDVEGIADTGFMAAHVRRAVEDLPDGERDAILLSYFAGHSYRDAARRLGLPEGTVKSRIRSGLRNLRRALDAEGVQP
jgi:RNA polymerase sigma-70 factor (ECF subfamily)